MNFTAKELEDYLRGELLGKDVGYKCGAVEIKAYIWIRERITKEGKYSDPYKFNVTSEDKSFNKLISYRGHSLGEIMVKREKGKHHYSYWGNGYNDWTYKDIHVEFYNDDLDARIKEIDEYELEKERSKQNSLNSAKEAFKLLKDTYNLDDYGARELLCVMYNNKYSLSN